MDDFLKEVLSELAKIEQTDMSGQWTFANLTEHAWENEAFETKDAAMIEAKRMFPAGFAVGQLQATDDKAVYNVINVEEIILN